MAFHSNLLPDSFRKCMEPETRKEMKTPTTDEAVAKAAAGEELKMHNQFEAWCRLNNLPFIHSRTDRKSTIQAGHPDFTVFAGGRVAFIEFKTEAGKLSQEQVNRIAILMDAGCPCYVPTDLGSAIEFTKQALRLRS